MPKLKSKRMPVKPPQVAAPPGTVATAATAPTSNPVLDDPNWFRDRIREFRRLNWDQLEGHAQNWRRHGPDQKYAMRGLLAKLGFVDALIVRELPTGMFQVLNGHMRMDLCEGATNIPCLIVDVTDEEAKLILATHDTVAEMALSDDELADELAMEVWQDDDQAINTILRSLMLQDTHREVKDKAAHGPFLAPHCDTLRLPYPAIPAIERSGFAHVPGHSASHVSPTIQDYRTIPCWRA